MRPCRRAQLAWALFGLLAGVALCLGFTPRPIWRVIAASAALALAWLPGVAILWSRGPLAVRGFEWAADGEWHLVRPNGVRETGHLAGATAALGSWILLAWTVGSRRWHPLSRRYALIRESQVGPEAFRALRGRLSLQGGRQAGRSGSLPGPATP